MMANFCGQEDTCPVCHCMLSLCTKLGLLTVKVKFSVGARLGAPQDSQLKKQTIRVSFTWLVSACSLPFPSYWLNFARFLQN